MCLDPDFLVQDRLGSSGPHCTKWADDQQGSSLGSSPTFPSPNPHYNRSSGHWPWPLRQILGNLLTLTGNYSVKNAWCRCRGNPVCTSCGQPYLSLRGPSFQALTLLRGAWFIAWRLMCPFLGECWWGLKHFWSCHASLGYGPASRPTLKKPCAILGCLVGYMTNSVICWLSLPLAVTRLRLPDVGAREA